jgi:diguanylate cyclase (GGDEF)-like protein
MRDHAGNRIQTASLLSITVVAYFTLVRENIVPCIVAITFTIGLIRGLIAIALFRNSNGRETRQLFAISMTAFALMSFTRGFATIVYGAPSNYLQGDGLQTFTFAASLVSICLTGLFFLTMCNRHALALVRNQSEQDLLSGTFNRRGIEMRLDIELKRTARSGEPLSIALIDVDNFKMINDTVGHAAGDAAIRSVARAISDRLRAYDSLGRFGGDEFLLILPKTRCTDAQLVVDRLAKFVGDSVSSDLDLPLTLSIGLTEVLPGEAPETVVARADKALYAAKHAGRNCSRALLYEPSTEPLNLQAQLFA